VLTFIVRRILSLVPVLIGISVVVFLLLRLTPGDPATVMLGERATPEKVAVLREQLGLNRPLWEQYIEFVGRIVRGDLGRSIVSNNPVADELGNRLPATVELVVFSMCWGLLIGLPMGVIAALKRNTLVDIVSMVIALLGVSIPIFWLGLMMIYLFGVWLKWLPPSGQIDLTIPLERTTNLYLVDAILSGNGAAVVSVIRHLIMPSFVLSTVTVPILARLTRSAMLEVLNQDYIRTARSKGLAERVVIIRHALRNALLPIVTVVGLQIGGLLGGAILTETIFSWPGMGLWMYQAILNRDYPIVQAGVLVAAAIFVVMNLIVDLSYGILDPRIHVA
jgi:peptide/nickel transport system permease protein